MASDYSLKTSDGIAAPMWMFWKRRRYIVVLMAFLGFMNVYTMRVNLSVAIVAMTENRTIVDADGGVHYESDFQWDSKVKGFILSSFFYGYLITMLPGGYIANKLGAHNVYGVGIAVTSLLTLLTPLATTAGAWCLILVRVLVGMFQGVTFPCMHAVWSRWAPPRERSRMVMFSFAGIFVGTILANVLSGVLAKVLNWQSIFYVFGSVGCIWYLAFLYLIRQSPEDDRFITVGEKEFILQSLGRVEGVPENIVQPWKGIFTSKAVFALCTANFCSNWGFYTMLTQLPTFLRETLHFGVQTSGIISALPYFALGITLTIAGYLADWFQIKGIMNTTQVRRNFNCFAFALQCVFMLAGALIMQPIPTVICFILNVAVGAFAWSGFAVNHLDLSPKSASVLFGITNTVGTFAGIGTPILTGYLTANQLESEWKIVFYIASAVYVFGFIVYWCWGSGELQPWSIEMQEKRRENERTGKSVNGYDNKMIIED
ncbi:sialin-like [Uranotaenia lowii]|uniref:sialin-like n=1 Tax=Uranotaenia lowii TaxID=190385 RepID=UPI00247AE1B2|nr:sialin-like [Uranotaenia lowii]